MSTEDIGRAEAESLDKAVAENLVSVPWSALDRHQKQIATSGTDAIVARWEFGRVLVELRGDKKQQPRGRRAEVAAKYDLEASEITRRVQLAEKFTTEKEVVDASISCGGSWRRMIREQLTKRRQGREQTAWGDRAKATLNRWLAEVNDDDKLHAELLALLETALNMLTDAQADADVEEVAV